MASSISPENFGKLENVKYLQDVEDPANDQLLIPHPNCTVDEILQYLGLKEGPVSPSFDYSFEYAIYGFLILAREALSTRDESYLPPIHLSMWFCSHVTTFALSSLGVDITSTLVGMGLVIPSDLGDYNTHVVGDLRINVDALLGDVLYEFPGDMFNNETYPKEDFGKFKWYKTWGEIKFSSLETYPEFRKTPNKQMKFIRELYDEVCDLLYNNIKG